MIEISRPFIVKDGRKFVAVEKVTKTGANGEEYVLYNLYPLDQKPKKSTENQSENLGLYYEPYLYITDEFLDSIFTLIIVTVIKYFLNFRPVFNNKLAIVFVIPTKFFLKFYSLKPV